MVPSAVASDVVEEEQTGADASGTAVTPGSPAASRRKLCMATYTDSYMGLPPMYHEGLSLAGAGVEVLGLGLAKASASASVEEHVPGFTTRRFPVRSRNLFHALFGDAAPGGLPVVRYLLSYAEFTLRTAVAALRSRADVYEAHDLPALPPMMLAAKLRRRPIAYHAHELWSEASAEDRFARFWRAVDHVLVPRCDLVVTPEENRSRILHDEFGAKQPPLTIPNCPPYRPPIESTKLRDVLARRGVKASTIVLYQGLVDSRRCLEEIAEATRHFADGVVLVIIGPGYGKWANPAAVLAPYERIVVLPPVPYQELSSYTASADVGILLYRNDCRNNYYCAPNKVFEYAMMGVPLIAPDYPGIKALVESERMGLCVDPLDPPAIAAAVNRIALDRELWSTLRGNGLRATRERYNWDCVSRPLVERLSTLAGR
jgi:glycosyltransferase involved in cell wall biosynthesis